MMLETAPAVFVEEEEIIRLAGSIWQKSLTKVQTGLSPES
jgi:hypothetical protein